MILRRERIKEIASESWSVSWPMALIMFFIFLMGLSDVYIAGRFGKEFQAAYGLAFQIYFIFAIIAMAFTVGSVSVISRLFTSDNKEGFRKSVSSSIVTMIAVGITVGVIAFLFSGAVIHKFDIPLRLKSIVISLMKIYSVGLLFHYTLINTNGILRACGMIRKSLVTMVLVCFLNVALNFFLAFKTSLGFKGIALATVVSTLFGSSLNLFHARRLRYRLTRVSTEIIKNIIQIGWPAGLLQILWQLGAIALFYILSILPAHNIETMAAFTNGLKIESLIFLPAFAFNMANAVLIRYIYISLLAEPIMAWGVILGGSLNGAGDTKSLMVIIGFAIWAVRVPLSYVFAILLGFGAVSVWWAMNFSMVVQSVLITRHYFKKRWIRYGEKAISI